MEEKIFTATAMVLPRPRCNSTSITVVVPRLYQQMIWRIIFSPLIPHITYSLQIIFFKKIWRYSFQIFIRFNVENFLVVSALLFDYVGIYHRENNWGMNEQNRVMRCYVTFTKAKIFLFAPIMKDIKKV